jgi:hypothetical protein
VGSNFDVFSGRKGEAVESESSSDDEYGEDIDDEGLGKYLTLRT